jgi:hypothetical protein
MESYKDVFFDEREREMIILTSPESSESERIAVLEHLRGQNLNLKKLNQHDSVPDHNLHHGNDSHGDCLWLCQKTYSGRLSDVHHVTLDCSSDFGD